MLESETEDDKMQRTKWKCMKNSDDRSTGKFIGTNVQGAYQMEAVLMHIWGYSGYIVL